MPKVTRVKYCEYCNSKLVDKGRARYCDQACRKAADRAKEDNAAALATAGMTPEQVTEAARKLAVSPAFEDELREVMRDEVRSTMQRYVRDRVIGFVDGMTGMLPAVLVQLNRDLNSESWPERKTAYAIITKYMMPLMSADEQNVGQNNLVIQIGSDAAEAFQDEMVDAEYEVAPNGVERFETDWPVCSGCEKRVHPDNLFTSAIGTTYCRSCRARFEYYGDKMPVEGGLSNRGRHADLFG